MGHYLTEAVRDTPRASPPGQLHRQPGARSFGGRGATLVELRHPALRRDSRPNTYELVAGRLAMTRDPGQPPAPAAPGGGRPTPLFGEGFGPLRHAAVVGAGKQLGGEPARRRISCRCARSPGG